MTVLDQGRADGRHVTSELGEIIHALCLPSSGVRVRAITPSYRNQGYMLHTGPERYYLRQHAAYKTTEDIHFEHMVTVHAARGGIRTPEMLQHLTFEGQHYTLYEAVPVLSQPAVSHHALGRTLAEVHVSLQRLPVSQNWPVLNIEERLAGDVPWPDIIADAVHRGMPGSLVKQIEEMRDLTSDPPELPAPAGRVVPQVVHGDFNPRNILHAPDGLHVIDWEDAVVAPTHYDLARALLHLCDYPDEEGAFRASHAFLDGYQQRLSLSAQDLRMVVWFMTARIVRERGWVALAVQGGHQARLEFLSRDIHRLRRIQRLGQTALLNALSPSCFTPKES